MGIDKKWSYLADIAFLTTNWEKILQEIFDVVQNAGVIGEFSDTDSVVEADDAEEGLDLQSILEKE